MSGLACGWVPMGGLACGWVGNDSGWVCEIWLLGLCFLFFLFFK